VTALLDNAPAAPPGRKSHDRTARVLAIIGLTLLIMFALAAGAIAFNNHIHGVYRTKDDAYRVLAIRSDGLLKRTKATDAAALKKAVLTQKTTDQRKLKRTITKMTKQRSKAVKAAQKAGYKSGQQAGYTSGYSSGNSAGYSSGHSAGVQDGLVQGSDQLTCSDDLDVYWLPACDF
jgi:hypothetical protein